MVSHINQTALYYGFPINSYPHLSEVENLPLVNMILLLLMYYLRLYVMVPDA